MSITVTISDQVQLAGAGAAAVEYKAVSTQAYLQNLLETMCLSYRDQFAVDRITSSAFVMRFPTDAYTNIIDASATDPVLAGFVAEVDAAPYVWLGAPQVIAGVNYCVPTYITQAQADAILAYPVPEPVPAP